MAVGWFGAAVTDDRHQIPAALDLVKVTSIAQMLRRQALAAEAFNRCSRRSP
jgi:hypothetical protein